MTRLLLTRIVLPLAAFALVSCGDSQDDAPRQGAIAGGKILERSIRDDMLPYDTVRSQPPQAKISKDESGPGATAEGSGESESDAAQAAAAGPSSVSKTSGEAPVTPAAE